jgi:hypothetical protein
MEAWTIIGSQNVTEVVCLLMSSDSQMYVSFVQIIQQLHSVRILQFLLLVQRQQVAPSFRTKIRTSFFQKGLLGSEYQMRCEVG